MEAVKYLMTECNRQLTHASSRRLAQIELAIEAGFTKQEIEFYTGAPSSIVSKVFKDRGYSYNKVTQLWTTDDASNTDRPKSGPRGSIYRANRSDLTTTTVVEG